MSIYGISPDAERETGTVRGDKESPISDLKKPRTTTTRQRLTERKVDEKRSKVYSKEPSCRRDVKGPPLTNTPLPSLPEHKAIDEKHPKLPSKGLSFHSDIGSDGVQESLRVYNEAVRLGLIPTLEDHQKCDDLATTCVLPLLNQIRK